ncbi:MAG: hypothetical protein OXH57_09675 [Ekhidna sp.]|nr:hypothetical protein [Ekhidna sp.]
MENPSIAEAVSFNHLRLLFAYFPEKFTLAKSYYFVIFNPCFAIVSVAILYDLMLTDLVLFYVLLRFSQVCCESHPEIG